MAVFLGTLYTHNTAAKDLKGREDYHGRPTAPLQITCMNLNIQGYIGVHCIDYMLDVVRAQYRDCIALLECNRALSGEGMVRGLVVMCNGLLTLMLDHE